MLFSSLRIYLAVTVRGLLYQVGGSFTSWLLTVLSLPAPCLPPSSLGSFLSLSPSIRTRTTPDLSTISWIILPFLPMTLPVVKERESLGKNTWALADFQNLCLANVCPQMNCIQKSKRNVSNKQKTNSPTRFLGTWKESSINSRYVLACFTASGVLSQKDQPIKITAVTQLYMHLCKSHKINLRKKDKHLSVDPECAALFFQLNGSDAGNFAGLLDVGAVRTDGQTH